MDGETEVKLRVDTNPAHVHVDVLVRTLPTETWQKAGELVFGITQWAALLPTLPQGWAFESATRGVPRG